MTILYIIIVGGILGWLASMLMRTDAQQGIVLNVVVGIVGALLAGLIISPLVGAPPITSGSFSLEALLVSLVGAIVLLAIVNLFRSEKREKNRSNLMVFLRPTILRDSSSAERISLPWTSGTRWSSAP